MSQESLKNSRQTENFCRNLSRITTADVSQKSYYSFSNIFEKIKPMVRVEKVKNILNSSDIKLCHIQ